MENNDFIVSARKYRPTTFSSVVGQKNLTSTLQNAILTDRLAHSYLFCGSRGVGKTSCARIFAKTINCEHRTPEGDPCNECDSCRSFNEGRSFNIIELDAASNNGVEDMRRLTEQVLVPPTNGKYRVFIIDEVHMLSSAAFNAFLKTLEEPPSYIIFILATTEKHKIIPTILSRCQIYDFNRITVNDITNHLADVASKEGIPAERKALSVIANQADGALRDALSIFDQIAASSRGNITYQSVIDNLNILDNAYFEKLVEAFRNSDVASALLIFKEIRDKGFNTHFFIRGLQSYIRDLMVARDSRTLSLLDATDQEKAELTKLASSLSPEFYFMALSLINDADLKYRDASNKTFLTELLLIKLCQLLSPSPVFKGKEEGHLDSLQPLGASPAVKPVQISPAESTVSEPAADYGKDHEKIKKPVRANGLRIKSLSDIRSAEEKGKPSVEPDNIPTEKPDNAFTDEQLAEAWKGYTLTIPEKKMLVNLMRVVQPTRKEGSDNEVEITVTNELQKELLDSEKHAIETFLVSQLNHSGLVLKVNVRDNGISPKMWTEREVLENLLANYPEAGKFIKDLGLSLS